MSDLFGEKPDPTGIIGWAQRTIARPLGEVLIFDTETTDLAGEVIEICVVDTGGGLRYHQRFRPLGYIHPRARAIHGLTAEMLAREPIFAHKRDEVQTIFDAASLVLAYNASFDSARLAYTCKLHRVTPVHIAKVACLMRGYSKFYHSRHPRGRYAAKPLVGGDHSAIGDCLAALNILSLLAVGELHHETR